MYDLRVVIDDLMHGFILENGGKWWKIVENSKKLMGFIRQGSIAVIELHFNTKSVLLKD